MSNKQANIIIVLLIIIFIAILFQCCFIGACTDDIIRAIKFYVG